MRILLIAGWHHFAFLVISLALMGFGAGGTLLCLARERMLAKPSIALWLLIAITAAAIPVCTLLAQFVPVEARLVPALFWRQMGLWVLYWLLFAVPFLFGGAAIGFGLICAGERVGRVYAANLAGSAVGGLVATGGMYWLPAAWLPILASGVAMLALAGVGWGSRRRTMGCNLVCIAAVLGLCIAVPPRIVPDPDKYSAYVERLVRQDAATRIAAAHSPRSVVEAYAGESFHEMPFLSVGAAPPEITALTLDGHWAGSLLNVDSVDDADVVDHTLMAFPYALLGAADAAPNRVLLLGELSGNNVLLARRAGAEQIDVVQPDGVAMELLRGPLRDRGGQVFDAPNVKVVTAEPRQFAEHGDGRYDVIQLVTLEGSAAGSGGMGGLAQDHLVTVEGLAACLDRLENDGVVFACRGIQTPPRDNIRLLATLTGALRQTGVTAPQDHVVIVRDYLAVCTLAKRSSWSNEQVARIRAICEQRQLTPVWFPGIREAELNQPDALPSPPDGQGDWYHHAATMIFSDSRQDFCDRWPFDVAPPTDDRPFFLDFCKLSRLGELRQAFGDMWLTRTELAFPLVLATIAFAALAGALLTLAPLAVMGQRLNAAGRGAVLIYFAALGLGYLMLEVTFLVRLTLLIGDAVLTAAVTISTFLLASGAGSLAAQRFGARTDRRLPWLLVSLLALGAIELPLLGVVALEAGSLPIVLRCVLAALLIAPPAFFMGFPMPTGLARLDRGAAALAPWAWGINGFASVLAAPLATALAMSWGLRWAGFAALGMYAIAALVFRRLPGAP